MLTVNLIGLPSLKYTPGYALMPFYCADFIEEFIPLPRELGVPAPRIQWMHSVGWEFVHCRPRSIGLNLRFDVFRFYFCWTVGVKIRANPLGNISAQIIFDGKTGTTHPANKMPRMQKLLYLGIKTTEKLSVDCLLSDMKWPVCFVLSWIQSNLITENIVSVKYRLLQIFCWIWLVTPYSYGEIWFYNEGAPPPHTWWMNNLLLNN